MASFRTGGHGLRESYRTVYPIVPVTTGRAAARSARTPTPVPGPPLFNTTRPPCARMLRVAAVRSFTTRSPSRQSLTIIDVHIGNVLNVGIGVCTSPSRNAPGVAAQDVVDNRQVVRGQVPNHVHVVLEQPEVDPHAVHVVQVAELAAVHQLADLA